MRGERLTNKATSQDTLQFGHGRLTNRANGRVTLPFEHGGLTNRAGGLVTLQSEHGREDYHRQGDDPRPAAINAAPNVSVNLKKISEDVLRAGFMKKVYGLLASQLILTVLIASICMYIPPVQKLFVDVAGAQTWWLRLAFAIPPLASLFALDACRDTYPANYIVLFIFTVAISLKLGFICSVISSLGYGNLVLQAAGITAVTFVGLSVYAVYSGKDFSYIRGFLYTMLWGLVVVGFAAVFFPWLREGLIVGFFGAATFCGYILYDTWRLTKKLGYDDYIGATIELYLDIVNLFLHILDILIKLNGSKKKKK